MAKSTIVCGLCILLLITSANTTIAEEIWKAASPMYVIESKSVRRVMLCQKLRNFGVSSGYVGGYQLDYGVEKHITSIENSNSMILATPSLADFESLKKIEQKHPNLLPMSCNEILHYPPPFMFFDYDYTGRVRGIIVAEKLPENFADFLINNGVPLKKAFWYENGIKYLQKLENPWNPEILYSSWI